MSFILFEPLGLRDQKKKPKKRAIKRYPKDHIFSVVDPELLIITIFLMIGIAGAMHFTYQIKKSDIYIPPPTDTSLHLPTETIPQAQSEDTPNIMPRSQPVHITFDRLGIDSEVMQVGKLPDGTMETPPVLSGVTGWYKHSPTPGELGPSIIVGHVDSYEGPSVFWRLREAVPGDTVVVKRKDGKTATFKVTSIKSFEQDDFPTQRVYGNIDYAGLRLITCGGTFNARTQHYDRNTVVFAELVDESSS